MIRKIVWRELILMIPEALHLRVLHGHLRDFLRAKLARLKLLAAN